MEIQISLSRATPQYDVVLKHPRFLQFVGDGAPEIEHAGADRTYYAVGSKVLQIDQATNGFTVAFFYHQKTGRATHRDLSTAITQAYKHFRK